MPWARAGRGLSPAALCMGPLMPGPWGGCLRVGSDESELSWKPSTACRLTASMCVGMLSSCNSGGRQLAPPGLGLRCERLHNWGWVLELRRVAAKGVLEGVLTPVLLTLTSTSTRHLPWSCQALSYAYVMMIRVAMCSSAAVRFVPTQHTLPYPLSPFKLFVLAKYRPRLLLFRGCYVPVCRTTVGSLGRKHTKSEFRCTESMVHRIAAYPTLSHDPSATSAQHQFNGDIIVGLFPTSA